MHEGIWTLADCPPDAQAELVRELGISELTAGVLVRRGYSDPAVARSFLEGEQPPHDPFLLGDMEVACARIRAAVEEGRRICVHGDYDVDGIAATTLALLLLRELGADVVWHLPSRFDEGYGVSSETLARLADDGCGLVLTVDCGITAVDRGGRGAGTRPRGHRHRPSPAGRRRCRTVRSSRLDRPSTRSPSSAEPASSTSWARPCSASTPRSRSVTSTSSLSRRSPTSSRSSTRTVRSPSPGCAPSRAPRSPGCARSCRAPESIRPTVDAGAVGFRLAPRLNAAGRLGHPREALELLLTEDEAEARRLADSLEELNRERQAVEGRILREAVAQVEAWPPERRARRAYAVAGADWHEGVIGIVASRLVERYHRPVVLIAGTATATGRDPAARSLPSTSTPRSARAPDLLGRWGGHRAAAGLSIEPRTSTRSPRRSPARRNGARRDDLEPVTRDRRGGRPRTRNSRSTSAPSSASSRRSGSATRRRRSSPRLSASPSSRPSATASTSASGSAATAATAAARSPSARARGSTSFRPDDRYDVAFRLEENHWNGTVSPQLVVRRVFPTAASLSSSCANGSPANGASPPPRAIRKRPRSSPSSVSRTAPAATCSSRRGSARCSRHGAAARPRRVIRLAEGGRRGVDPRGPPGSLRWGATCRGSSPSCTRGPDAVRPGALVRRRGGRRRRGPRHEHAGTGSRRPRRRASSSSRRSASCPSAPAARPRLRALVRASLDAVRARGANRCCSSRALPLYYGRFGFVRADELGLLPPPGGSARLGPFQVAVLDPERRRCRRAASSTRRRSGTERARARAEERAARAERRKRGMERVISLL